MWPTWRVVESMLTRKAGRGLVSVRAMSSEGREESKLSMERLLKSVASSNNQVLDLHKFNPAWWSGSRVKAWAESTRREADLLGQRFIQERLDILGNDLAAAHFIVFRGGKVRLNTTPSDSWLKLKEGSDECPPALPKKFMKGVYLQAIDAAGLPLRYEGLVNLEGLSRLEWLSLAGCPHVDDWCVDRISRLFANSLRHLDLSDCPRVTERSLGPLYRFADLRTLVLHKITDGKPTFHLGCLLLEQSMPNLSVLGIQYMQFDEGQETLS